MPAASLKVVSLSTGRFQLAMPLVLLDNLRKRGVSLDVTAVSNGSTDLRTAVERHGGYWVTTLQDGQRPSAEKITAIDRVLVMNQQPNEVVAALADPEVSLVTATIMQTNYFYHPTKGIDFAAELVDSGEYRDHIQQVVNCVNRGPGAPASTSIGAIVEGLYQRYNQGERRSHPLIVMSLDGMDNNGAILEKAVRAYAERRYGADFAKWIGKTTQFPTTMVDRIVPSASQARTLLGEVASQFDRKTDAAAVLADPIAIVAEPMPSLPWVIGGSTKHPVLGLLKKAGALVVPDCSPYLLMKLRILNAMHFVGGMAGQLRQPPMTYFHEVINDPELGSFLRSFVNEVRQTLPRIPELDRFIDDAFERLGSRAMPDPLTRLTRNHLGKAIDRITRPVAHCMAHGLPHGALVRALAIWTQFTQQQISAAGARPARQAELLSHLGLNGVRDPEIVRVATLLKDGILSAGPDGVVNPLTAFPALGNTSTLSPSSTITPGKGAEGLTLGFTTESSTGPGSFGL